MKLEELKKKLYRPEAEFEERLKGPEAFQPGQKTAEEKILAEEWQKEEKKAKKKLPVIPKKYLYLGLIVFGIFFVSLIVFLIWLGLTSFDKEKVELTIEGPERIVSGEEVRYLVKYKNNTRLDLKNIKLVFSYPTGSIPLNQKDLVETIDLSDLLRGQQKQTELLVRIIGTKGEIKKARAELSYQPGKLSSRFVNSAEFETRVISVPLILDFDLPERLVSGQSFNLSLKYLNQADVSFKDLQIRVVYPVGFNFQSAEPEPFEEDKIWSLGHLMAGQEDKIFIRGDIQGEEGQAKLFKAQLGLLKEDEFIPYTETVSAIQISLSPLSVTQTVNGQSDYIAQAGEKLNFEITYKNTTDIGIRDIMITSKLEGNTLNLAELKLGQGSFDGITQTITWRASNLPALEYLAPHQEDQISFSVEVKDSLPINNYTDKNFTLTNTVKIDSKDVPLSLESIQFAGQSKLVIKIASQLNIQAQGFYNDDLIPNSGPIPPRVGQTTTYTIKWRLVNTSNDLSNVKVKAFLPPHSRWLNRISPTNADIKYNPQTGQLVWLIGDLPAATGILLPVKQAAFQISITPSLAHLGNLVELIGQSKVIAHDNFINSELINTDEAIDTDLPDDLTIDRKGGIVVE